MALCGFGAVGFSAIGNAWQSLPSVGFTELPTDLFANYSSDGTDITIPIASLTDYGLTVALANTTTGDPRTIAKALVSRIDDWWADLDADDRPTAFVCNPSSLVPTYGDFAYTDQKVYKFTVYLDRPTGAVVDEP